MNANVEQIDDRHTSFFTKEEFVVLVGDLAMLRQKEPPSVFQVSVAKLMRRTTIVKRDDPRRLVRLTESELVGDIARIEAKSAALAEFIGWAP